MPGMVETKDLVQLRQLNLALLRQLWVGQDAVRRSVAKAASKSRVTLSEESALPDTSWRLRPYLGYDWIAGSLDNSSPVTSKPEAFFSKLRDFREANKEECISSDPEPQFLGPRESSGRVEDHEYASVCATCGRSVHPAGAGGVLSAVPGAHVRVRVLCVSICTSLCGGGGGSRDLGARLRGAAASHGPAGVYCYRVSRRLFLVPSDPGTPCRLCRTPRDQRRPETLVEPAQVRVSIPLSVLDPPHRYHIHRRKSFDASDTLALPRHCLLGWDILPPKSEKSSAPKSLDLRSCVSSEAQHRKLPTLPTWNCCPDFSLVSLPGPTHSLPHTLPNSGSHPSPGHLVSLHLPMSLDQGQGGSSDLLPLLGWGFLRGRGPWELLILVGPSLSVHLEDMVATSIRKSQDHPWVHKEGSLVAPKTYLPRTSECGFIWGKGLC
ncbi:migration and invasion-inhibitory protein isoform X3 [Ailuropoda melanoleuca]|uniref:migration and invasion-inhibitory protein isoform X3 n=1 Tax=Ailuropoda melanoleuca TaxID=9646 RepID=UPI0014943209|nr:migration and invasion-inhibitory protein isoform X3 [Ailuropoda melanoleuca]